MKDIVKYVLGLATEGHNGQFRKDKITPYISHPIAVREIALQYISQMNAVGVPVLYANNLSFGLMSQAVEIVALAHDLVEDHPDKFTIVSFMDILHEKFEKEYPLNFFRIIESALISVTHSDPKESYLDYVLRAKKNKIGRIVKLSDISHNLSTLDVNNKHLHHKREKYELARYILLKD